jgi:hypothetical protein
MPLIKSSSDTALKRNISKEIASGRPPRQAAAIAHSIQREAQGKKASTARKSKTKGKTK